jgi:NAD+ dependent glucose-6-phosphate dehydrogenase
VHTVLVTGAAGLFGGILRQHWGDRFRLRLADVKPVTDLAAHEAYVETDIVDLAQLEAACEGVDTVIHLAAYPGDGAPFYDTLLQLNVIGAYNAFEAARRAGCDRLVLASSVDAVRGYWDDGQIGIDTPVYPTNMYGATKCWAEALARVYSSQHQLSCICVRLVNPFFDPAGDWHPEQLMSGISPRDAAALLARCVDVEGIDFAIVNGISRHRHGVLDWRPAQDILGFEPQDGTAVTAPECAPPYHP